MPFADGTGVRSFGMRSLADVWPFFGLTIRTPRLELRTPTDADYPALLDVIDAGIHDPATMPFVIPWTDISQPGRDRQALQYWWGTRAGLQPENWRIELGVFVDGEAIGFQGLMADDFPKRRQVETGSWLGLAHQGKGYGKEMRAASVQFAFEALCADWVVSTAFPDNVASNRVSLATGYEPDGINIVLRRGEPAVSQRYRLSRARWDDVRPDIAVTIEGWSPACREMLGLADT